MSTNSILPTARDESILTHTNLLSLHISPTDTTSASPSVIALQQQISAYLPTREWFRLPPGCGLQLDHDQAYVSSFAIQHGEALPQLSVRVLPQHVVCDEVHGRELDASLQWLMESIGVGSSYPVIGVDCESDCTLESDGEVRLLQLSTGTRCLLIRIPEQSVLREVVAHAALEKQVAVAAASSSASATAAVSQATSPLFTPLFHSLMANRSIFKSGAELWTDALDLWACTGMGTVASAITSAGAAASTGTEMNSCLNMSWIYRNENGGALSLAAMVNLSLHSERCFLKDKVTTTSDWGAKQLNIRQLIYAALDAQASFIAGANQSQIPKPFHVSDMPKTWLASAAAWKQTLRASKISREARTLNGVGNRYDPTADALENASYRYFAQYMQGEEPFHPFVSTLLQITFPQLAQAQQSMPPPNAHLMTQANSTRTMPLSSTYFQGEDLAIETSNVAWWFASKMEPSTNFSPQNTSELAELLDRTRLTVVSGPAGSGKSMAAAVEAVRSLQRSSTIPLDHAPLDMRGSGQRVLLLTETEYGARAAAEAISKFVSANDAMLLLSTTFLQAWDKSGDSSDSLTRAKAMVPMSDDIDRPILICSIDYALGISVGSSDPSPSQWRLHHRQTVLIDDAAQVWLLKLILLLRRLPHTERLILFGDDKSYQARWGEHIVDDVFGAALTASRSSNQLRAIHPFLVQRHRLSHQYRMNPHITAAVSEAFYQGKLSIGQGERLRGLGWVDVRGNDDSAVQALLTIWTSYLRRGIKQEQMAVIVLNEQTRSAFATHAALLARTFTPETFQGRSSEIVFLVLSPSSTDKRRLLLACTRAMNKLFLLGDRLTLTSPTSPQANTILQTLCEFESRDLEVVFPELSYSSSSSPAPSDEIFPSAASSNGLIKAPVEVPTAVQGQIWGAGTLSFTKAATSAAPVASPEKRPPTAAAIVEASPEPRAKTKSTANNNEPRRSISHASTPSTEIQFQSAPESRSWKMAPCEKTYSSDGRRLANPTCHAGDKCTHLHQDFWIRRGVPGEFVLFTPGSKVAYVEVVEPFNDRRQKQMETLCDSKLNKLNKEKGSKEFGQFFPIEDSSVEESTSSSSGRSSKTNNVTSTPSKGTPPTTSHNNSPPVHDSPPVADESSSRIRKRGGGRKKVTLKEEVFEQPPPVPPSTDDFVPVSRRHGGKHLAADLAYAAEQQAAAEAEALAQAEAEQEAYEAAERRRVQAERDAAEQARRLAQEQEEEEAAAAAAAAAEEEEERAAAKKKGTAEPEPAVDYAPDMLPGSWWLPDELSALSKNARKKLLWLCPGCRAPNINGDARCSLCHGSKPAAHLIRFAKPPGSLGPLPKEVEGKFVYENEWVKLVASSTGGAPMLVAAKAIPAGTVILREDAFYSEITVGSTKAALVPQPRSCAQLAAQLLNDPIQMALIRSRWNSSQQPWSDVHLKLFLRNAESASGVPSLKPKDPNLLKEWPMAMAYATTAKFAREDQDGHTMECKCHRFKLPRQSSILIPSCWPNTAVVCLHTDPMLTPDQMAILAVTDIPVGAPLTNVSDQALLNLPADRRQQTISLVKYRASGRSCYCDRCNGKLANEQEKLLCQEIPGYSLDKPRMTTEYDKVMIAYSETQHSKSKIYKKPTTEPTKDANGKDVTPPIPKDAVTESGYFSLCYAFLSRAFEFLTVHPLHACHWRMQKVRELYLSLVRCDFLYRIDYMVLAGLTTVESQHTFLRQIVHVLDAAIRSDQQFFREMEPMKSLPLLTLLELCTFLIQNKVTIRPSGSKASSTTSNSTSSSKSVWRIDCLEFEGIGRFDSQAAYLLNLSQLNQYAAIIRNLNFPYRRP